MAVAKLCWHGRCIYHDGLFLHISWQSKWVFSSDNNIDETKFQSTDLEDLNVIYYPHLCNIFKIFILYWLSISSILKCSYFTNACLEAYFYILEFLYIVYHFIVHFPNIVGCTRFFRWVPYSIMIILTINVRWDFCDLLHLN